MSFPQISMTEHPVHRMVAEAALLTVPATITSATGCGNPVFCVAFTVASAAATYIESQVRTWAGTACEVDTDRYFSNETYQAELNASSPEFARIVEITRALSLAIPPVAAITASIMANESFSIGSLALSLIITVVIHGSVIPACNIFTDMPQIRT